MRPPKSKISGYNWELFGEAKPFVVKAYKLADPKIHLLA